MNRNGRFFTGALLVAGAVIAACSSSSDAEPPPVAADGGNDPGAAVDSASPAVEGGGADAVADGPKDASTADTRAETSTPALCSVYPSESIAYDGDAFDRYLVIALDATKRAKADCLIATLFANFDTPTPVSLDCLTVELRSVAACLDGSFTPITYDATTLDVNSDLCLPSVKLGFKDAAVVTEKDFERFVEHIRAAAVVAGYSTGAASALVASVNAKKGTVVTSASAAYSNSTCDGGL